MATRGVQDGCTVGWTNNTGADVASDDFIAFGMRQIGLAAVNIADGEAGSVHLDGVVKIDKATNFAIVQGAPVWIDLTTQLAKASATLNSYFAGYAFRAADTADDVVHVSLEEFCYEGSRTLTLAATGNQSLGLGDILVGNLVLQVPNTAAKTITFPDLVGVPAFTVHSTKTTADAFANTYATAGDALIVGGATYAVQDAANDYFHLAFNGTDLVNVFASIA